MVGLAAPESGNSLYVARITPVETVSAIERRARRGSIGAADAALAVSSLRRDVVHALRILELSSAVAAKAFDLAVTHGLRGYDAVQLATCVCAQQTRDRLGLPPMVLVSSDAELSDAAVAEGLLVEDPRLHQ